MNKSTNNLRNLRKQRGITQGDLANSTGISVAHISAAETGSRKIKRPDWQKAIAEFYGVPLESIVEFNEELYTESRIKEVAEPYRTHSLSEIRKETLPALLNECARLKDWGGAGVFAEELKRREGKS